MSHQELETISAAKLRKFTAASFHLSQEEEYKAYTVMCTGTASSLASLLHGDPQGCGPPCGTPLHIGTIQANSHLVFRITSKVLPPYIKSLQQSRLSLAGT